MHQRNLNYLPFINMEVSPENNKDQRIPVRAMLDCGASKTLMCILTLNAHKNASHFTVHEFKDKRTLSSALINSSSEILAKTRVNLVFNTIENKRIFIPHEIYLVSGLAHTLFLGNDFIRSCHHVLNTAERMIIKTDFDPVKDISARGPNWHDIEINQQFFKPNETLLATEDRTIAAESLAFIPVTGPNILISQICSATDELFVPEYVYFSKGEKEIKVPCQNFTSEIKHIRKGQIIAEAWPESEDASIHSVRIETTNDKSLSEPDLIDISFIQAEDRADESISLPSNEGADVPLTDEQLIATVDMSHLEHKEKVEYVQLLRDNIDIFSRTNTDIGCTHLFTGHVEQKENVNPGDFQPRYVPVPVHLREATHKTIRDLLKAGVLKYAATIPELISNVHIRVKPNGTVRLCLDSRSTNYLTKRVPTPPAYSMEEILVNLSGRQISLIDISQSFFNIPLSEESFKFFSFLDPDRRVIQLTRACQGFQGSPSYNGKAVRLALDLEASATESEMGAHVQKLRPGLEHDAEGKIPPQTLYAYNPIEEKGHVLPPEKWQKATDKIVLFNVWDDLGCATDPAGDHESHRQGLQLLFNKIRRGNFKLRIQKLQLCPNKVKLLGYEYTNNSLIIPPKRLTALREMTLKTPRQVRSFIASAAYYRIYASSFSRLAYPLMQEANKKKGEKLISEEELNALRDALINELERNAKRYPYRTGLPLLLQTDSSKFAAGATLDMIINGKPVPVASMSRVYNKTEQSYNIFYKEAVCVFSAMQSFEYYLKGAKDITLISDVRAFLFIRLTSEVNSVAFRLSCELSKYNLTLRHQPSRAHHQSDVLSRHEDEDEEKRKPLSLKEALILVERIRNCKERYAKEEVEEILRLSPPDSLILPRVEATKKFPKAPRVLPLAKPERRIRKPNFVYNTKATKEALWRQHVHAPKSHEMANNTFENNKNHGTDIDRHVLLSSVNENLSDRFSFTGDRLTIIPYEIERQRGSGEKSRHLPSQRVTQQEGGQSQTNEFVCALDTTIGDESGDKSQSVLQGQDYEAQRNTASEHLTGGRLDLTSLSESLDIAGEQSENEMTQLPGSPTNGSSSQLQEPFHTTNEKREEESSNGTSEEKRQDIGLLSLLNASQFIIKEGSIPLELFRDMQEIDPFCARIKQKLKEPYEEIEGILFLVTGDTRKICLPEVLFEPVLHHLHYSVTGAHRTKDAIERILNSIYYHPKLTKKIRRELFACTICMFARKDPVKTVPMIEAFYTKIPRTAYYMDLMDAGKTSELELDATTRYYLICICAATNYICLAAMANKTFPEIKRAFTTAILNAYGIPHAVVTDNESAIKSAEMQSLLAYYGIEYHAISPHAPQSNKAEGAIKRFKGLLRPLMHELAEWEDAVPLIVHNLNATPDKYTRIAPEAAFFHSTIGLPGQALRVTKTHDPYSLDCDKFRDYIEEKQRIKLEIRRKRREKHNVNKRSKMIEIGQLVTVRDQTISNNRSLRVTNLGPYIVTDKETDSSFWLQHAHTGTRIKRHLSYIFPILPGFEKSLLREGWDRRMLELAEANTIDRMKARESERERERENTNPEERVQRESDQTIGGNSEREYTLEPMSVEDRVDCPYVDQDASTSADREKEKPRLRVTFVPHSEPAQITDKPKRRGRKPKRRKADSLPLLPAITEEENDLYAQTHSHP